MKILHFKCSNNLTESISLYFLWIILKIRGYLNLKWWDKYVTIRWIESWFISVKTKNKLLTSQIFSFVLFYVCLNLVQKCIFFMSQQCTKLKFISCGRHILLIVEEYMHNGDFWNLSKPNWISFEKSSFGWIFSRFQCQN